MDGERHLRDFFAAWMRFDPVEMGLYYAENAVMEDPTLSEPRRGRSAIERYYADMFASLEDPYHELVDHAVAGERIWFEWRFGSGGGAQPRVDFHGVSIQAMAENLVVHDAAFWTPR